MLEEIRDLFLSKIRAAVIFGVALLLLSIFSPLFIDQVGRLTDAENPIDPGSYMAIPIFIFMFFYFIAMILCFGVAIAGLTDFLNFEEKD